MFQNQQTPNNSSSMNSMGRFGDNQTVHAQSGELVVPQSTLQENPELGMGLAQAFMDQGVNPYRQIVGSGSGSMNPMTGQQEFFDLGKLLKTVAPIAIGAMIGPGAGAGIGSMFGAGSGAASFLSNPFVSRAITGALTSKLSGGKNKDAIMAGLLSGGLGAMFGGGAGTEAGSQATQTGASKAGTTGASKVFAGNPEIAKRMGVDAVSKTATDAAAEAVKGVAKDSASPSFLNLLGIGDDSLTGKFLGSGLGQGLSAGLIMQLLAGDDDEDIRPEFERRPFCIGS